MIIAMPRLSAFAIHALVQIVHSIQECPKEAEILILSECFMLCHFIEQ